MNQTETDRAIALSSLGVPLAFLEITPTGLGKSIMDATDPVRRFLSRNGIHAFDKQPQGLDNKRLFGTVFLRPDGSTRDTQTSLYRPTTKLGDPRIWVYGLKKDAAGGDVIGLAVIAGELWVFNLSRAPIDVLAAAPGRLFDALTPVKRQKTSVMYELTQLLAEVSRRGFIPATGKGDTMVGRVLETALGIGANSRKAPDYRGIELKAFRLKPGGGNTHSMKRRNLFAKTPNWGLSELKSSREIVDTYGYESAGIQRLYCEVRAGRFNTQGLKFVVDVNAQHLREVSDRVASPEVAVWELPVLENDLGTKHAETFWVGAESRVEGGQEYFRYVAVEHTKQPLTEQFGPLVTAGHISMDHLIKRKGHGANEKGPLFKIDNSQAALLFPSPRHFRLDIDG